MAFVVAPAVARETYRARVDRLMAAPPQGIVRRTDLEAVVFDAANAYRASKHKRALVAANATLQSAALAQAYDMAAGNYVGHVAGSGQDFEARMRALHPGQMALARLSENAARERSKGPPEAPKALKLFQQWVNSSSHRHALLSADPQTVATAVVAKGDHLYAVQIFAGAPVKSNMMFGNTAAEPAEAPLDGLY